MNKAIIISTVLMVVGLGACTSSTDDTFDPKSNVRLITSTTYPELPNIEPLPDVNILPWEPDVPRDTSVISVKNTTECRKVDTYVSEDKPHVVLPKEEQTPSWWSRCGENPILPNSNIYIGFSQDQWNIIIENFVKLKERVWQYKQRIMEVNRQRESWRKKADEERLKTTQENNEEQPKKSTDTKENVETPSFLEKLFN